MRWRDNCQENPARQAILRLQQLPKVRFCRMEEGRYKIKSHPTGVINHTRRVCWSS